MERLKQKVASSRVFASLQQVAQPTGAGSQTSQTAANVNLAGSIKRPSGESENCPPPSSCDLPGPKVVPEAAMSTAWLMAADATAHLTDEERGILLEVFKKEEQFQRDTIKQLTASRASQQQPADLVSSDRVQVQAAPDAKHFKADNQQRRVAANSAGQSFCASPYTTPTSSSATTTNSSSPRPCSCNSAAGHTPNCSVHATPTPSDQRQVTTAAAAAAAAANQSRSASGSDGKGATPTALNQSTSRSNENPFGQCRICRKTIGSSEPCHLCSNCQQFVCDDCASYSSSHQHWMCSSCRRRTMNPAIPTEALKELGLNQNSSAVRRMTLRLSQNELKLAMDRRNSAIGQPQQQMADNQSISARNSTSVTPVCAATRATPESGRIKGPSTATSSGVQANSNAAAHCGPRAQFSQSICDSDTKESQTTARLASIDSPLGNSAKVAARSRGACSSAGDSPIGSNSRRSYCESRAIKLGAQKTMSQPQPFQNSNKAGETVISQVAPAAQSELLDQQRAQRTSVVPAANREMSRQQQWSQQVQRSKDSSMGGSPVGSRRNSRQFSSQQQSLHQLMPGEQMQHMRRLSDQSNLVRRSSIICDQLDGAMISRNRSHSNIDTVHQAFMNHQQQQQQQAHQLLQQHRGSLVPNQSTRYQASSQSFRRLSNCDDAAANQQQQLQQQPYVLSSSSQQLMDSAGHPEIGRFSNATGPQFQQNLLTSSLDYSNSLSTSNVLHLPEQGSRSDQQRRLSDGGQYVTSLNAAQLSNQQQIASIITTYAQKQDLNDRGKRHRRRQSSEDLDDDANSSSGSDYENNQYNAQQAPISIPSVSVSEFNHRRQSIQQQQRQLNPDDGLMFAQDNRITPMQINVAIEQVIQQQQQHEQLQVAGGKLEQQLLFMAARRGSSGRVLPRIPGDQQSRSLLELPRSIGGSQQQLTNDSSSNRLNGSLNSSPSRNRRHQEQQRKLSTSNQLATLDLPLASPTIRRASAPEGQNIKIVVDDIDHNGHRAGGQPYHNHYGHHYNGNQFKPAYEQQAHYLERHILCRDDSLDPNGLHVGRGFGLQVMGGKLDEEHKLQACITWVLPGGPADKMGLIANDKIVEWDGKCLVGMSYEQVAEVIESSANVAELLVKPAPERLNNPRQSLASTTTFLRSQRRMSQQTERDLCREFAPPQNGTIATSSAKMTRHNQATSSAADPQRNRSNYGTGRKLPQIPSVRTNSNDNNLNSTSSDPQYFTNMRHASTGQLDQGMQQSNLWLAAQDSSTSSHLTNVHLSAYHQEQQQTRSANELHRASICSSTNYIQNQLQQQQHQQQQQQQQQQFHGGQMQLGAGFWSPMQRQQYGGSQQTMSNFQQLQQPTDVASGGPYYSNQLNGLSVMRADNQDRLSGLIGLQVSVDELSATLEISVLAAHNIERDLSLDYYVRVRILPESSNFAACTTQPSNDMNWKEKFIFRNFPTHNIQRMALEIGVWVHQDVPRLSAQMAQPICEALIPIQSARERNIDFWPLRPPPTSPQTRRKSLNDLIGSNFAAQQNQLQNQHHYYNNESSALLSTDHKRGHANQSQNVWPPATNPAIECHMSAPMAKQIQHHKRTSPLSSSNRLYQPGLNDSPTLINYRQRERSSSNRNLPDTSKLQIQPRRASDEVATSSSHRIISRMSPAPSRRSISVMNVGDNSAVPIRTAGSRLGSQANIMKVAQMRRDSGQIQSQQPYFHQPQQQIGSSSSNNNSPNKYSSRSPSGGGSVTRVSDPNQQSPISASTIGQTPSGRRSSLVGIQSMSGYRSQKNSQSDAADHELRPRDTNIQILKQQSSTSAGMIENKSRQPQQVQPRPSMVTSHVQQPRQVASGPTSTRPSCSSNSGSRRGSSEQQQHAQLQRRGSFAMQTLRKLKRTMSLTKGDNSPQSSNHESRKSSDASNQSVSELGEDLAATRSAKTSVGRIKLGFIMSKGQFEVEVICASGLRFERHDPALGIYVKTYLKGKSKSNKRKTRLVQQPLDSPMFKQTIRYDGSLIDNKILQVSVWIKQRTLRGKLPIGLTEIRLSELNLAQPQTSWYNLRSMDTLCSSSIED